VNKFWPSVASDDDVVRREEIAKAVEVLMGRGDESGEIRRRARKLCDEAKKSIEEGGSSYNNLIHFIDEIKSLKISREIEKTK
jgi:hypothetical protein